MKTRTMRWEAPREAVFVAQAGASAKNGVDMACTKHRSSREGERRKAPGSKKAKMHEKRSRADVGERFGFR